MSKIGKKPIAIPEGIEISISTNLLSFKGKLGSIEKKIDLSKTKVENKDKMITITPLSTCKQSKAMHGTIARIIQNGITGISKGFTNTLYMNGVGYRSEVKADPNTKKEYIIFNIGKSYEPRLEIPSDIKIEIDKKTTIKISGHDKEKVGQVTAIIKSLRPREPYKGRGIATSAEKAIPLKQGKSKSK